MTPKGRLLADALFGLAVLATVVSLYLVYDHVKDEESSFCDVGAAISCSKVRRSAFSEILHVPVAVFGFLFNCASAYMTLKLRRSLQDTLQGLYMTGLFYWNALGCLFIFYLIGAEIYLQTICPMCTVIHIIQISSLIASYLLHYEVASLPTLKETLLFLQRPLAVFVAASLIAFILFNTLLAPNTLTEAGTGETRPSGAFGRCLEQAGWVCFGRSGCSWCDKQKQLFSQQPNGPRFVDCRENAQKDFCEKHQVTAFPTWIQIEDGEERNRWKGYASVETLHHLSDCPIAGL